MNWTDHRDEAQKIRSETVRSLNFLLGKARCDGRFPADHTNDIGDPDNSSVVKAERAAWKVQKLLDEIAEHLTLPMTAAEAANVQDHS